MNGKELVTTILAFLAIYGKPGSAEKFVDEVKQIKFDVPDKGKEELRQLAMRYLDICSEALKLADETVGE